MVSEDLQMNRDRINELWFRTLRLYEAKYPNATPDQRPALLGEAISHLFFSIQSQKQKWEQYNLDGTESIKEELMIEAIPFSYMPEDEIPRNLLEYFTIRKSSKPFSKSLQTAIIDSLEKLPVDKKELIKDGKASGAWWAVLF